VLREADACALRAAGYFVLSFSRPEVTALARLSGWCEVAWDVNYDARRGVERHYSDGGLVVYFHPSARDAASDSHRRIARIVCSCVGAETEAHARACFSIREAHRK
jgi:hypothetical protein